MKTDKLVKSEAEIIGGNGLWAKIITIKTWHDVYRDTHIAPVEAICTKIDTEFEFIEGMVDVVVKDGKITVTERKHGI